MNGAVERIVVALDAASEHRVAISTAARLAARWNARLHGVFVEDDDFVRLAALPFARQFTVGFGAERFDIGQAQRQMRVFAERARQELAALAARHGVGWSFEIVSGHPSTASGDFFVACTATRPVGGSFRLECRWWAAETGSARLLAHREHVQHAVVAALLRERDSAGARLLTTAARLAEASDARLVVICTPELVETPGFKTWLDECLAGHAIAADIELLPDPAGLHRRLAELDCRLVAMEAEAEEARPENLRALVAAAGCDVLIVP